MKNHSVLLIAWMMLIAAGCAKEKSKGTTANAAAPAVDPTSSAAPSAETPGIAGTLAIALEPKDGAAASTVANALVVAEGRPEIKGASDAAGVVKVSNVLPGTLTLYVTSDPGAALVAGPSAYGLKFESVVVESGKTTDLGAQRLKQTGSLIGKVHFYNNPNNLDLTGSEVFIPGTSFIAKTDGEGGFSLAGLPVGKYDLRIQHTGFAVLNLADVEVAEGAATDLGTLALSLSNGPEGSISVTPTLTATISGIAGNKISTSRTVNVSLKYDSDAALMKISDEPSFLNKAWEPVASTKSIGFTSDGPKSVYIMYSDLNGLESSPYKDDVFVDTIAPTATSFTLLHNWVMTARTTVYGDFVANDAGTGIAEYMLSNVSGDFNSGETWQPLTSSRVDWTLIAGDGAKTVYARVRDHAGRISNVVSDNITKGAYTKITNTTYSSPLVLKEAQSPFLTTGTTLIFDSDLSLEAGVTINIPESSKMSVKGVFSASGTVANPVIIREENDGSPMCNVELYFHEALPGISDKNVADRVRFLNIKTIKFNGGVVKNSHFESTVAECAGNRGFNEKYGEDLLLVKDSTFTNWYNTMSVKAGAASTTLQNNSGETGIVLTQMAPGTGTIVTGGSYTSVAGETASYFTINSGSVNVTGTSLTGITNKDIFINYGNDLITVNNVSINTCRYAATTNGNLGDITLSGGSISGCDAVALNEGASGSQIQVSHMTITNTKNAGLNMAGVGYDIMFDHNDITVSQALANCTGQACDMTFTANEIICSNGAAACDIMFLDVGFYANQTPDITVTGNNIRCIGTGGSTTGCRGFTAYNSSGASARTINLTLNAAGNFWDTSGGGKAFTSNLETGVQNNPGTLAASVAAYELEANEGGAPLTVLFPNGVTESGSAIAGAGAP